jgi:2-succinyl-5-enolpyruvyl-6-hydroxy-3-cyclohexene-1-carboxylate synthase
MPIRDLDWFMEPGDVRVLSNRGASGIDGFVSSVMVAATGAADPVTALAGDLSILHDSNGFLLRDRPDCVFVVVNNNGGGIFSMLPQAAYPDSFEVVFGTPHDRSFEAFADFHGLAHQRIAEVGALEAAVGGAHAEGGVHLVEVETDRSTNVEVHRQATEVVRKALDAAGS